MNKLELETLRKELIKGKSDLLGNFYLQNKQDCLNVLRSKNLCSEERFEDIFTDALIIFHNNVVSNKIQELSSIKNYLIGTCINLAKKNIQLEVRMHKKMDDIRLLFYANNDTSIDEQVYKVKLIEISRSALKQLSERCQQIIEAYYLHQLSMKEIAKNLELSSSDVAKTLKSRCYKRLLDLVKKLSN